MAFVFSFRVQNNIDFGPPRRGQIKYGSIDRDDYWLTEDSGGTETSYEIDVDS
jgi:hypothetical protein